MSGTRKELPLTDRTDDLQRDLDAWRRSPDPSRASATLATAESILETGAHVLATVWHAYLEETRHPEFLEALPDAAARDRWAETTFRAVVRSSYTLETMFAHRAATVADRALFREIEPSGSVRWGYPTVLTRIREIAAVLWGEDPSARPRPSVALLCDNGFPGACGDLACLLHDLPVSPINVHFDEDALSWVLDRVRATVVLTDTPDRVARLRRIRDRLGRDFRIYNLGDENADGAERLAEVCARLAPGAAADRLAIRPRLGLHDLATTMFTSGSTGRPKGVAFSIYNLVTKRFARGAALPTVGREEVFLSYLPLFHTFGRYLEMLGALYWEGTYVFADNPSAETLLAELPRVCPTALISIPLRWVQIRDRVLEGTGGTEEAFRDTVGDRLRWGLSAAGYLDPRVFRFFQRHGVALCSGFGMTEATGGITMTPPGAYRDDSVGVPLPGVRADLGEDGELRIAGPYIARYLADDPADDPTDDGQEAEKPAWLPTGDLFRRHEDGHLEIVDRIKDIYKNTKGQTIAPRRVESRFVGVPGISRTFLVGDGRSDNTLLIVPDHEDPVLEALVTEEALEDYFHQIVTAANRDLASYERVVDFTLLSRDFELEQGELTPKGSYRRKAIEANFSVEIAELYRRSSVELDCSGVTVRVPRWFLRELGVLETDIETEGNGLVDRVSGRHLRVGPGSREGRVRIGHLEYALRGKTVDLGRFARQPLLWGANPSLQAFAPCRPGWDTALKGIGEQVFLPPAEEQDTELRENHLPADVDLAEADRLCRQALFGPHRGAVRAVDELAERLPGAGERVGRLVRRRLEALASHEDFTVRCRAYQVLLLDEPVPDYSRHLPAFVHSGRPFLSEESISAIAGANVEPRRLHALRRRMHGYRTQLPWPATAPVREIFEDLFRLLADFARRKPAFYGSVRQELVSWAMLRADPELARSARRRFTDLADWFEDRLEAEIGDRPPEAWNGKLVFQEGLDADEIARLRRVLVGTSFLDQSILLTYDGEHVDPDDVPDGGIWVSRILSLRDYSRYRVSVNLHTGKHYDLQLIVREDLDQDWVLDTILLFITIEGHPYGAPVLPRFGCCRPELGAISLAYVSDLSVWERIREISSLRTAGAATPSRESWRRLFVAALTTIFTAWKNSGRCIIPGLAGPTNVVVREPDFREGHLLMSLMGWKPYRGPASLVRPMLRDFFQRTFSNYPWCRRILDPAWILDACVEALGTREAARFLERLREEVSEGAEIDSPVDLDIGGFLERLPHRYPKPLPLRAAIERYRRWADESPDATPGARLELLDELQRLYRLDRFPEIARYTLFRQTVFAAAPPRVREAFDRLLERLVRSPDRLATRMVELSDLQATMTDADARETFRRLAFPGAGPARHAEVLTVGDRERDHVVVRTEIIDRRGERYRISEPTHPSEVGQVYRLFLLAGFPKTVSEQDRFLVVTDRNEQIVGGVCFQVLDEIAVHLDGIAVTATLLDRGITTAVLEDLCVRLAEEGFRLVRTHYLLRRFYERRRFVMDRRWGGLVRFLRSDGAAEAEWSAAEFEGEGHA
jgi:long-chain acyl-CoA synthetase